MRFARGISLILSFQLSVTRQDLITSLCIKKYTSHAFMKVISFLPFHAFFS